ncbi:DUF2961 domain-containing protein [Novipirellula sp. SH528]|uniref:DUF2961 domain-containing protein n=1 Tax=Novipirellula sp. SH528 TaxID=3454466 RepID=UPI003F9F2E6F
MNRPTNLAAVVIAALCLIGIRSGHAQDAENAPISIPSLLTEMVNRDSVARFPQFEFRLKQASSYNRASKTPDDPKGWFANGDFNKGEKAQNFLRIEENNGRKEWVLMEDDGPGVIVRTWMPFKSPPKDTLIRFYLDGSSEPSFEGNVCTLLNGSGLIPYPFAHSSLLSAVSFFPIPYAKSCKVTMTEMPYFYQITYRKYAEGTPVKTFSIDDFNAASATVDATGKTLLHPSATETEPAVVLDETLAPKSEAAVDLPAGQAAIRTLSIKLGSYDDPAVTRSTVLKISFDGKQTVWCPVGDFFGSGVGLNPFQGWYRTVEEDGSMSCRWTMPYQESARVSLVNLSDKSVDARLEVKTGDWTWDDRSMYFHSTFRSQYPVPTMPRSDWNYVTTKGRGVYVGDTLTIMNPVVGWWGEGDEKIWVDGEDFPSLFGTGTEDYYAYSWGGESTDFYEHPFHAQVRSNVYNKLNRKNPNNLGERDCRGFSTETRTRALDTMPFGSSLQLDMEVWSISDCDMGYAAGTYWYGFAETTSNRQPSTDEALNVPPLPDMTKEPTAKPIAKRGAKRAPAKSGIRRFADASECETMPIAAKSDGLAAAAQDLSKIKGTWSASSHLFVRSRKIGDFVELQIPAHGGDATKWVLHATKSHDYGIVRFTVNGKAAGEDVDLYAEKPVPSGPIKLGVFAPVDGLYVLRAEVVGKNSTSNGVFFGLDCVVVDAEAQNQSQSKANADLGASMPQSQPNIVMLISDDDDYEHFGFMGSNIAQTPALDELARMGTLFTTAHCPASLCRPSLASILSGRLPHQHGIYANYLQDTRIGVDTVKLDPTGSLPNQLKDAGYATYATAKYWEGDPRKMGFTHGTVDVTFKGFQGFVRNDQDELFEFIDGQHESKPMFIWWAPLLPHKPHNPPAKYAERFAETEIPIPSFYQRDPQKYVAAMRKFYAMGTWFDDGVADLVQKLKSAGEYENTIFLFYVDNGYCFGMPAKNSPTEKGLRTPMFVTWPGHSDVIPAGRRIDRPSRAIDLHATALDYAGLRTSENIESRSLRGQIEVASEDARDGASADASDVIYGTAFAHVPAAYKGDPAIERSAERDVYALYVRTSQWKYILYTQDIGKQNEAYIRMVHELSDTFTRHQGEENLYDLNVDPYEQNDLASDPGQAKRLAEFRKQVLDWWKRTGGGPLKVGM